MRFARDFRLLPVVLFATVCLFTLKVIGIARDGGYTLTESPEAVSDSPEKPAAAPDAKQSWAQAMFSYPEAANPRATPKSDAIKQIAAAFSRKDISNDVTGSVGESKPAPPKPAKPGANAIDPPRDPGGQVVSLDPNRPASAGERAILERLQERRLEIEAQAREQEIRDGLLKAAEQKLEGRVSELKNLEAKVGASVQGKQDADASRFKSLVAMYENMKPKDAAKIFDRLDIAILVQVTSQINPRKMSDILGQMSPEAAERLTVELANRAVSGEKGPVAAELPKIEGKPGG